VVFLFFEMGLLLASDSSMLVQRVILAFAVVQVVEVLVSLAAADVVFVVADGGSTVSI
jgi:hypothetical protein